MQRAQVRAIRNAQAVNLAGAELAQPALRDRAGDFPALSAHIAAWHAARFGCAIERIERRTLRFLESHPWPGNARELENLVERAVIPSSKATLHLGADDLRGAGSGIRG